MADVRVTTVRVGSSVVGAHPLFGTPVEILDGAVFEGRNGDIATSAQEPIVPFTIQLQAGKTLIVARDPIDLTDPGEIARRQPIDFLGNSPQVAAATGITDRALYRQLRRNLLQTDLASETDPIHRAALEKRIDELAKGSILVTSLGFQLTYEYDLRGLNEWTDPDNEIGFTPSSSAVWSIRFWMGGWDADALCGYVLGTMRIV